MELVVAYWWVAWNARNKKIFEDKKVNHLVSAAKAEVVVGAFQRVREVGDNALKSRSEKCKKQWEPPPIGTYKINVDAAIHVGSQTAGLGAVVRGSDGKIVMATVKTVPFRGEAKYSEAEVEDWGVQVATEAKMQSVIVETDCLEATNLVNNKSGSRTEIFWVISEIQSMCRQFESVMIEHTPRTCNLEAHCLAKFAIDFKELAVWANEFPQAVLDVFTKLKQ